MPENDRDADASTGSQHQTGSKRKKSQLWLFFTKNPAKKTATCHICGKDQAYPGGGNSNLRRHLKRHATVREDGSLEIANSDIVLQAEGHNESDNEEAPIIHQPSSPEHATAVSEIVVITSKSADRRRSVIWSYYQKNPGDTKCVCTLCSREFSVKGSLSNLRRHLVTVHKLNLGSVKDGEKDDQDEVAQAAQQIVTNPTADSISEFLVFPSKDPIAIGDKEQEPMEEAETMEDDSPTTSAPLSMMSSRAIDRQIMRMICKAGYPFSLVECTEFRKLLTLLQPRYPPPSRKLISNKLLPYFYKETKNNLAKNLAEAKGTCITIDSWSTSHSTVIYVCAHYFTNAQQIPELKTSLIGVSELYESQSSNEIVTYITEAIKQWDGLDSKIVAITADRNGSMWEAASATGYDTIPCFASLITDIVSSGMSEMGTIISKVKGIGKFFQVNRGVANMLKTKQAALGLPSRNLIQEASNQWNSLLKMLKRMIENRVPVVSLSQEIEAGNTAELSEYEWVVLEQSIKVFELFEQVFNEITSEKTINISKIPICLTALMNILNLEDSEELVEVTEMKKLMLASTKKCWAEMEKTPIVWQAVLLDPRFKMHAFENDSDYREACRKLREKVRNMITATNDEPHNENEYSLWRTFDQAVKRAMNGSDPVSGSTIEVDKYLNEPILSRTLDPLTWWSSRKSCYPRLYQLMLETLCVSPTSVPSTDQQIKRNDLLNEKRSNLQDNKLAMLLFLGKNLE